MTEIDDLFEAAINVRRNAHAPFSDYRVGAALETESGEIYTGCNVESDTFTLTTHAEQTAMVKAISHGESEFSRILIVTENCGPPCPICRQILMEHAGPDLEVICVGQEEENQWLLKELYPEPFLL